MRRYTACYPVEAGALHSLQEQLLSDVGIFRRTNMRGHITTSALVLDVTRHQALLIHPLVYDVWLQPGGHYELPGSLWQSACREVAEETGLRAVRPFLALDVVTPFDIETHDIPARASKGEEAHRHHDFAYLGVMQGQVPFVPQQNEVLAVRWATLQEIAGFSHARTRRPASRVGQSVRHLAVIASTRTARESTGRFLSTQAIEYMVN